MTTPTVHPTHVLANGECVNCEAADPNWNLPAPCLNPTPTPVVNHGWLDSLRGAWA